MHWHYPRTVHISKAMADDHDVMKTDVKGYYETIDHTILLRPLDKDMADPSIWRFLVQVVKRSVERGRTFKSIPCGISRGCTLSPVIDDYRQGWLHVFIQAYGRPDWI
jgi:RNA-directed DNA polymerase